jgi:hypothetical protein
MSAIFGHAQTVTPVILIALSSPSCLRVMELQASSTRREQKDAAPE